MNNNLGLDEIVDRLLSYCCACLKDLKSPNEIKLECCACGKLLCRDCETCVCDSWKENTEKSKEKK